METKLVTFNVAAASDPNFPFQPALVGSPARIQQQPNMPQYFWIVAAHGTFNLQFPRPPQAGSSAGTFTDVIYYLPADCGMTAPSVVRGMKSWPTWFDGMQALSASTIK
jgi:hypothetical protein